MVIPLRNYTPIDPPKPLWELRNRKFFFGAYIAFHFRRKEKRLENIDESSFDQWCVSIKLFLRYSSTPQKVLACKGQLISKCPVGVIVWTKKPTNSLTNFCPRS